MISNKCDLINDTWNPVTMSDIFTIILVLKSIVYKLSEPYDINHKVHSDYNEMVLECQKRFTEIKDNCQKCHKMLCNTKCHIILLAGLVTLLRKCYYILLLFQLFASKT